MDRRWGAISWGDDHAYDAGGYAYDVLRLALIERSVWHYFDNRVDMDATMSKEQILSLFDELVPEEERGGPGWGIPGDTEISEVDGGVLSTRIPYESVTLAMYGKKDSPERQKYVAAIISWDETPCSAK